ncbi:MAG: hypothetical protein AB1512_25540 [Thermodesulfobacteriota bacterium]
MTTPIILNDTFVLRTLGPVATGSTGVLFRQIQDASLREELENSITLCQRLFDEHHGISPSRAIPSEYRTERTLFTLGMDILGKVLNLENLIKIVEPVIEIDWKAHLELNKEKRYRDHITHPVRVTAIGWWLLHEGNHRLLKIL